VGDYRGWIAGVIWVLASLEVAWPTELKASSRYVIVPGLGVSQSPFPLPEKAAMLEAVCTLSA